ncbi:hypothetical protein CROQUDRAFT_87798 [Cronartium quercuum f. sp. fusiforme G11]|uniref:Uncharacterized protein n=1 Tax=Cronartium quercuum f. sp. fusiforme G11 TaxID=708437 RepID=A0A9P6TFG1_9BASI|nr:hypothetical protein CROQUDRAFT_87798 [Cronartium quercuum f. sp. fusiforme G11]
MNFIRKAMLSTLIAMLISMQGINGETWAAQPIWVQLNTFCSAAVDTPSLPYSTLPSFPTAQNPANLYVRCLSSYGQPGSYPLCVNATNILPGKLACVRPSPSGQQTNQMDQTGQWVVPASTDNLVYWDMNQQPTINMCGGVVPSCYAQQQIGNQ